MFFEKQFWVKKIGFLLIICKLKKKETYEEISKSFENQVWIKTNLEHFAQNHEHFPKILNIWLDIPKNLLQKANISHEISNIFLEISNISLHIYNVLLDISNISIEILHILLDITYFPHGNLMYYARNLEHFNKNLKYFAQSFSIKIWNISLKISYIMPKISNI